uniref:Methyltransferase-like protein 5 n=1 Tax=Aceria tosichella TaxID=561515 RepID=A0A6G1SKQ3_9ACAR
MQRTKKLSIKQLESYLQDLDDFERPKIELEQYATPPHIAALLLNAIDQTYDDLDGKLVCDLGCGTGRLAAGSVICGAKMVFGFDLDQSALDGALQNFNDTFNENEQDGMSGLYQACPSFNLIQADIASQEYDAFWKCWHNFFDTVIMNPPFGTKQNAGLDIKFLERAINLSKGTVYSLHKTSTRDYILSKSKQWAVSAKPIAQIRYNLENTYKFHKRKSVDIDVDLWRVEDIERIGG